MLNDFIPQAAFVTIKDTLQDIIVNKRSSLLSFGFIMTIYFSSNGIFSLMEAFNKYDARGYWQKRAVSLLLFLGFFFLTIMGLIVFVAGEVFIVFLESTEYFKDAFYYFLLELFRFIISLFILFFSQSILFYFGTAPSSRYRFFSPGAFLATLLSISSSYLFAYYVDNFSQYNKFYGSLGALIALMIWLYINSLVLIIGYEFNKSIVLARNELK